MAAPRESVDGSVRRRRVDGSGRQKETVSNSSDISGEHGGKKDQDPNTEPRPEALQTGTFWLTRIVLLRSVSFIYCE